MRIETVNAKPHLDWLSPLIWSLSMNRLLIATLLWASLAGMFVRQPSVVRASGSPAPSGTYDVGGTVYFMDWEFGYVVIETQKGCYQTIYPDSNTVVTVHGLPATLANITVGNRIRSSNSLTTFHTLTIDLR